MEVTSAILRGLRTGLNTSFQNSFSGVESQYGRVAMTVPSTTTSNTYGWLKDMPEIREWVGDRYIHNLEGTGYAIENKDFELTIGVNRNAIEDDNIGIYTPFFQQMGERAAKYPDKLVFSLLKRGFDTLCFDGQYFFDTDHKVLDENGVEQSVSNTGGGSGTPWFLLDTTGAIKPLIYQERKKFNKMIALDNPDDPNVFMKKQFIYGVDGRCNVGFGFWQKAYGSKQPLTADNYASARAAMGSLKADYGRPLGVTPNLLVVPPTLEGAARKILKNAVSAGGEENEWAKTAEIMVSPWLA